MNHANYTILVVDDEPHIVNVVKLKLEKAGFNVLIAEDGEHALELATRHKPDLIITDHQMPYMNGLDFCKHLKIDAKTQKTPIIMLTARGANLSDEEIEQTNITSLMHKPFSPREILAMIEKILQEKTLSEDSASQKNEAQ